MVEGREQRRRYTPTSWWGVAASLVFVAVPVATFLAAQASFKQGVSSEEIVSLFRQFGLYSVLVLGVGLLIRAAVHGQSGRRGKFLDGIGKIVGVLGWALGLVAAVFFALGEVDEGAQYGLFEDAVVVFIWAGGIVLAFSLLSRNLWNSKDSKEEPMSEVVAQG